MKYIFFLWKSFTFLVFASSRLDRRLCLSFPGAPSNEVVVEGSGNIQMSSGVGERRSRENLLMEANRDSFGREITVEIIYIFVSRNECEARREKRLNCLFIRLLPLEISILPLSLCFISSNVTYYL